MQVCGKQYAAAIYEFSRMATSTSVVSEINFVVPQQDKVRTLEGIFDRYFPTCVEGIPIGTTQTYMPDEKCRPTGHYIDKRFVKVMPDKLDPSLCTAPADLDEISGKSESGDLTKRLVKQIGGWSINIYQGDIRNLSMDVIVCPEDDHMQNGGYIATGIKFMLQKDFREETLRDLGPNKKVIHTKANKTECQAKYFLHTYVRAWKSNEDSDELNATLIGVLEEMKKSKKGFRRTSRCTRGHTIAIPLLGLGKNT